LEYSKLLDLDWLFRPQSKQDFFDHIWQKKPKLIVSGRSNYFSQLFDKQSLERIIEFSQPQPPSIRLKSVILDEEVEIPLLPNGRINIEQLRKYYMKGHSLILNSVEDYDPQVAQLARSLETEMGARVQVNSYLTPQNEQGFKPHYDTHDVIVAQIDGHKLWKIYPEDSVCPLNEMVDGAPQFRQATTEPQLIKLSPGDILYLPRGWVHEAETEDNASLHLTFGLHPPLAKDLLYAALEAMVVKYPQLREALPIGPLAVPDNRQKLEQCFTQLISLYAEHANVHDAAQVIDDQLLRRSRSAGDGRLFGDIEALSTISPETQLQRRRYIRAQLVRVDHETIGLKFLNELIKGPNSFQVAIDYVLGSSQPFYVKDLPQLEASHQLVLASSMVSCGLCSLTHTRLG
jgi:ribosomal protein L16 Arg81 hydroxylase